MLAIFCAANVTVPVLFSVPNSPPVAVTVYSPANRLVEEVSSTDFLSADNVGVNTTFEVPRLTAKVTPSKDVTTLFNVTFKALVLIALN